MHLLEEEDLTVSEQKVQAHICLRAVLLMAEHCMARPFAPLR